MGGDPARATLARPDALSPPQSYMEDHLKNKNRLQKEWEALCAYQAEPSSSLVAQREENAPKNRCPSVLACTYCGAPAGGWGRGAGGGEATPPPQGPTGVLPCLPHPKWPWAASPPTLRPGGRHWCGCPPAQKPRDPESVAPSGVQGAVPELGQGTPTPGHPHPGARSLVGSHWAVGTRPISLLSLLLVCSGGRPAALVPPRSEGLRESEGCGQAAGAGEWRQLRRRPPASQPLQLVPPATGCLAGIIAGGKAKKNKVQWTN